MPYQFKQKAVNPHFSNVEDISPQELIDAKKEVALIDVREVSEYHGELGHIEGAELMVLSSLPEKIETLPKDKCIVFVCRSGGRSAQATSFAKQHGYTHVFNMLGGMILWNNLQFPIEK